MYPNRYFDLHHSPFKSHRTLRKMSNLSWYIIFCTHGICNTASLLSIFWNMVSIWYWIEQMLPNFSSVFTESSQLEISPWPPFTPNFDKAKESMVPMEMLSSWDWDKLVNSWFWLLNVLELYPSLEEYISTIVVFSQQQCCSYSCRLIHLNLIE